MLYPLTFQPIFKERIWGGRNLERLYGKVLPQGRIGESWEISDRPGDESIISNGPFARKTLGWLVENHRPALLGSAPLATSNRFPLLIKLLDAQEKLSLQVHPPAGNADELGGEPKTEMWFIAEATPAADLFVGLKRGTSREAFERKIRDGSVADCFHRIPVKSGDCIFLPSGRVHAIGAGNVIFEIQQNSDTTYRVFDWNRVEANGKPRELHVEKSLASIDFADFEPALIQPISVAEGVLQVQRLVDDPLFRVERCELKDTGICEQPAGVMHILGVLSGLLQIDHPVVNATLKPGEFALVPASETTTWRSIGNTSFLRIRPGV